MIALRNSHVSSALDFAQVSDQEYFPQENVTHPLSTFTADLGSQLRRNDRGGEIGPSLAHSLVLDDPAQEPTPQGSRYVAIPYKA